MIPIPAFSDARFDKALRGTPMTIYLVLLDRLHPVEWREVPQLALCYTLDLSKATVIRAFKTLVERGYIEGEPGLVFTGHSRRWRLVYRRRAQIDTSYMRNAG